MEGHPKKIWELCHKYSGLTEEEFFSYFTGREIAFALVIEDVEHFSEPIDPYAKFSDFVPPQSYCYWHKPLN